VRPIVWLRDDLDQFKAGRPQLNQAFTLSDLTGGQLGECKGYKISLGMQLRTEAYVKKC
jgi:hypothetical protein